MIDIVQLREYEDKAVDLPREDVEFIATNLRGMFTLRRDLLLDRYVLNPQQFVGVVTLPSGITVESLPKVPVGNVFYMLAVAHDLPSPFREELVTLERFDQLLEFVAAYFADLVDQQIDHGLYRAYVDREDNLPTVRGRIRFAEDLRQNAILRHRIYCEYTEFTWDIPENQVIRQVVHALHGWGFSRRLRSQLGRIDMSLAEVMPTNYSGAVIDRFHYHRLNDEYRLLHQFCRLFLEAAGLTENLGPFRFPAFLIDMNKLFEHFVTQLLRLHAPPDISIHAQSLIYLGYDKKVLMRPDLVLRARGALALVADCKYKQLGPEEYFGGDVYQVLAYCVATGVKRGMLIYPTHEMTVQDEINVRGNPISVDIVTIDLGGKPEQFLSECGYFVSEIIALST